MWSKLSSIVKKTKKENSIKVNGELSLFPFIEVVRDLDSTGRVCFKIETDADKDILFNGDSAIAIIGKDDGSILLLDSFFKRSFYKSKDKAKEDIVVCYDHLIERLENDKNYVKKL